MRVGGSRCADEWAYSSWGVAFDCTAPPVVASNFTAWDRRNGAAWYPGIAALD